MNLLCVETSSIIGSLNLFLEEDQKSYLRVWQKQSSHSEIITTELSALLEEAQLNKNQITHIGVDLGPGSFTGIRVGVNFAKTLSYALDIPILGVDSLRVLGSQIKDGSRVLVALDALRNRFYSALFQNNELFHPIALRTKKELSDLVADLETIFIGDPLDPLDNKAEAIPCLKTDQQVLHFPRADMLSQYIRDFRTKDDFKSWNDINPLYIRLSSAEEKFEKV